MKLSRPLYYTLVDGKPVPTENALEACRFMDEHHFVRQDFFVYKNRGLVVLSAQDYAAACQKKEFFAPLTPEELEHNRKARKKKAALAGIPIKLSTIFLGIDHDHFGEGPPILWETMVFGVDHAEFGQHRYRSEKDAITGHLLLMQTLMQLAKVGKLEKLIQNADGDEEDEVASKGDA